MAASFADAKLNSPLVAPNGQAKVDPVESLQAIAQWQYDNRRNEAAEESYSELIRMQPDSGDRTVWKLRGDLRRRLKRFEEAISDFDYVLESAPNDKNVLGYRCYSNMDLGRFSAALTDANKLIETGTTSGCTDGHSRHTFSGSSSQ